MKHYSEDEHINVGSGHDIEIAELATLVAEIVGFSGNVGKDPSKPDGTPRKLLDVAKLRRLGWHQKIDLRDGLADTYRWYLDNAAARSSDLLRERAS
jgi:GDP-L-fucose synthase